MFRNYIRVPHVSPYPWTIDALARAYPWMIDALARAYHWPTGLVGGGKIAIGELGGGSIKSDLEQFCKMVGMPIPTVVDHSVNGGVNNGDPTDPASGEVALDIQSAAVSYWVATGKPAEIHVYYAPNGGASLEAVTTQSAADGMDVLSWSWGANEAQTGTASCISMEKAVHATLQTGMVTLAASGDNGSRDIVPNTHVDSPASCPHVLACGGTKKTSPIFSTSTEIAWIDGGGGFSTVFGMSRWMSGAPHGGRIVPDWAANAAPDTGVKVVLNGQVQVFGGTSFCSPFLGGLIAACGKKRGLLTPDGIGPLLWSHHMAFDDITKGSNGMFRAKVGPDACTGLGVPHGKDIAAILMAH